MNKPLGIIAGLGDLPVILARDTVQSGRDVYIARLKGFVEPRLADYPGTIVGLGEIGKLFKILAEAGCEEVTFAGIVKRPNFSDLKLDLKGAALLPRVIKEARKGDDALLRVMVQEFERNGFIVRGSNEVQAGLLTPAGCLTRTKPDHAAMSDMKIAASVAAEIGRLDIGQGCVVSDGLVLAVEAQEGTDEMLRRCATLPADLRGREGNRQGLLLKCPKPVQERRIDLPVAGLSTVQLVSNAGLAGIALEAGGSLLLDKGAIIAAADAEGIFVYGFTHEEMIT